MEGKATRCRSWMSKEGMRRACSIRRESCKRTNPVHPRSATSAAAVRRIDPAHAAVRVHASETTTIQTLEGARKARGLTKTWTYLKKQSASGVTSAKNQPCRAAYRPWMSHYPTWTSTVTRARTTISWTSRSICTRIEQTSRPRVASRTW